MFLRFGILTISDRSSRGERPDVSGRSLKSKIESLGWKAFWIDIVPDETKIIAETLIQWADSGELDVVLTTGGTGFSPRDVTPEATLKVIQKLAPGLAEAMRQESLKITPHAMLSRGVAGIRGKTLIINLPGSPKAALENFEIIEPILPHAVQLLQEDENSESGHKFQDNLPE
jgi:molybdopterin adenylyltransferase